MHDYETDLDTRSYRRLYREESAIAFSAMDCVLNGELGVYASSELTTGERAYARLRDQGVSSTRELEEPHRSAIFKTNTEAAAAFAGRLREELRNARPGSGVVITPAPLNAPGWTQAEYLAFWETLIRTRVAAVYFNTGWEYSNGCTFEFAVAAEHGIPTFDAELRPLATHDAIARVEHAVMVVTAHGFDPHRLRINLDRLRRAAEPNSPRAVGLTA